MDSEQLSAILEGGLYLNVWHQRSNTRLHLRNKTAKQGALDQNKSEGVNLCMPG
jgi:hypothetical protein